MNKTCTFSWAFVTALLIVALTAAPLWRVCLSRAYAAPSSVLPEMVTRQTARRIQRGLKYLHRTQRQDGSWLNSGGWGTYPVVMTSLAALAMMAGGSTPESGPYARSVRRALNYVLNVAESNAKKGDKKILIAGGGMEGRSMYGHGFGMLFLAQCYGVEGDKASGRAQRIKKVLQGAVALTVAAQSDLGAAVKHAGGWIYTPNGKSDEGSVTVTQLQALRACRNVGIKVPPGTINRAVLYLKACQQPDGGIRYSYRQSHGNSQRAISAAAIACFYSAGVYDEHTGGKGPEAKMVEKLVKYCKANVGVDYQGGHFFYTHFYMAQGMYQRGGKDWKKYYPRIRDRLAGLQQPDGNWNGDGIGEVYGTAIAAMILQLPYGYLPIMQR
ncbi:MAG: terpene cyclase/mutase family protein [Candidatus Hydrogenedentes bacterium]|nr:terpene cyclase/mutase family protein [Candidatus Hydrogenedentota bacterium]